MSETQTTVKMSPVRYMAPISHVAHVKRDGHTVTGTYSRKLARLVVIVDHGTRTEIENVASVASAEQELTSFLRGALID